MRCSNSTNKADTVQVKLLYVVFVQVLLLKILFTLLCTSSLVIVQSIQKVQVQNNLTLSICEQWDVFFFRSSEQWISFWHFGLSRSGSFLKFRSVFQPNFCTKIKLRREILVLFAYFCKFLGQTCLFHFFKD
jgi:hypothetical protein